ncbi:hypothetical protein JQ609_11330 [Bradyrhizobium sp. AUGA SZCCT0169]|uniref:primase-helicase family protein n=1 Tax=Bradyrhizobium sp. AUGA SZCCT0169 TaxID=2807663 RepID=UPI001BAD288F|nr:primase-helicase family protein [Bradyrhizobium sp. AUGA SZCCT0169]MBR1247526.1 hypothetical protein [Bradyrhizobium sp. AUGA SZCCT0169]
MTHDSELALVNTDAFTRPPGPEEIDKSVGRDPWILRNRLTIEAYSTRCRLLGQEPNLGDWLNHVRLTGEELSLLNDFIEAMRERHRDELGPKFVIRDYGHNARVAWFDETGELVTMSFAEFRNAHIEKVVDVSDGDKKKFVPLVDHWLHHPLTRRFDKVDYRLGVNQSEMPDICNLWQGWPSGLTPGWDDFKLGIDGPVQITQGPFDGPFMPSGYCDTFLDHMLNNMCGGDDDVFTYLLGWVADALWNPGPCETAIVLIGPQGSGKSLWVQFITEFFGNHAITLDDPEQLTGKFNKHLQNKSLVFADEAFFAGNKKHAAKLKTIITRPDFLVEPKGVDTFRAPKQFRLVMASNDEHVIQAERDDRRNLVLRVDAGENNQNHEYFGRMHDEWRTGGRRAFFRWLTGAYWGRCVGEKKFRMWSRPVTAALQTQKDLSLTQPQMAVYNMLREGDVPGLHKIDSGRGMVFVSTVAVVEAYRLGIEHQRVIGDFLRLLAGPAAKGVREYVGEGSARRQARGFWLPPLDVCRKRWEAHFGRTVQWPEVIASWTEADELPTDPPF